MLNSYVSPVVPKKAYICHLKMGWGYPIMAWFFFYCEFSCPCPLQNLRHLCLRQTKVAFTGVGWMKGHINQVCSHKDPACTQYLQCSLLFDWKMLVWVCLLALGLPANRFKVENIWPLPRNSNSSFFLQLKKSLHSSRPRPGEQLALTLNLQ